MMLAHVGSEPTLSVTLGLMVVAAGVWFHFARNLVVTAVAVGSIYQALQDNNEGGIQWAPKHARKSLMGER